MKTLNHKFVENIPDEVEEEILYVSIPYETVIHKCCCGCGKEVVTPLSPTDWSLIFNGEAISLKPSIGNWSFECRSHYWIKKNKVVWGETFSSFKIEIVRNRDNVDKQDYFGQDKKKEEMKTPDSKSNNMRKSFWESLFSRWM